ncbi:AMP-binding protein [Ideonella sp. DXS29W]|uniref:AMP-binding protein n=1 Tax=Ideonella lacteola TaxID=2984193 RepID=A0ABU9BZ27_9BURK
MKPQAGEVGHPGSHQGHHRERRRGATLPAEIERELFDRRRFPVLGAPGRQMLRWLRGHPNAPVYRQFSGHRLGPAHLAWAHWRQWRVAHAALPPPGPPRWLDSFVRKAWAELPARRRQGGRPPAWADMEPMGRHDLSACLPDHVPRSLVLDELICFTTSGTTGHPLRVPSHPVVAAEYLAYHRRALRQFGIVPHARAGEVGIVLAGYQQRCFTYVSVNPLMGECGLAKLNLMPHEWRHPDDRAAYLDACAPELISGDPVSLAALADLPLGHRPRALLSTSMALSEGLRQRLQARFQAPVLDIYSMNEAGPIGVYREDLQGFALLQPWLYVEILDEQGRPRPEGEPGEIVLSGGFNFCLPLLRYRTGDHARLVHTQCGPVLRDLQGRSPVRFQRADGRWVNNIEITHALKPFDLVRYALHQGMDAAFELRVDGREPLAGIAPRLREALVKPLGLPLALTVVGLGADDKLRQYTSDLPGHAP